MLADLWYGLLEPTGLLAPLLACLNATLTACVNGCATDDQLRAWGMVPFTGTSAEVGALIARDVACWAAVVREAQIAADRVPRLIPPVPLGGEDAYRP